MKNIMLFSFIVISWGLMVLPAPVFSEDLVVRPHIPMGHKLPIIIPPKGEVTDPNDFPRVEGKVSLQILFETEKGLDLQIKQFLTKPQSQNMLWEDKSIPPEKMGSAKVPIMGSLDTEEGMITTPISLPPGQYFITLVVDNRKGTEDINFMFPHQIPRVIFYFLGIPVRWPCSMLWRNVSVPVSCSQLLKEAFGTGSLVSILIRKFRFHHGWLL